LKKKFLPRKIKLLLSGFLLQGFLGPNLTQSNSISSDDELITLLFYKFIGEIFNLILSFSPDKVIFLGSQDWKNVFNNQLTHLPITSKYWEYL